MCVCWAHEEGGVQAPLICQPGWEQITHLASRSLVPFLPAAAGAWGRGRRRLFTLAPMAGFAPAPSLPRPHSARNPRPEIWGSVFRVPGLLSHL